MQQSTPLLARPSDREGLLWVSTPPSTSRCSPSPAVTLPLSPPSCWSLPVRHRRWFTSASCIQGHIWNPFSSASWYHCCPHSAPDIESACSRVSRVCTDVRARLPEPAPTDLVTLCSIAVTQMFVHVLCYSRCLCIHSTPSQDQPASACEVKPFCWHSALTAVL